jgi:hypothetical protein
MPKSIKAIYLTSTSKFSEEDAFTRSPKNLGNAKFAELDRNKKTIPSQN